MCQICTFGNVNYVGIKTWMGNTLFDQNCIYIQDLYIGNNILQKFTWSTFN